MVNARDRQHRTGWMYCQGNIAAAKLLPGCQQFSTFHIPNTQRFIIADADQTLSVMAEETVPNRIGMTTQVM